uniref:Uncharacterized protein n=1 Tax=Anguilla anguilla TaxID=7936 RepID=A0A0E9WTD7_ANGAN
MCIKMTMMTFRNRMRCHFMRNVTNAKEQLNDPAFDILIIFLIEVQNCSNCLHKE